jgi:nucleotide-binding universal stress UspA family protein
MGLLGHVMLGGVAERILHSAELPIVVAPRGFHAGRATTVSQVSAAFGRADQTIANSKPGGGDGGLATRVETALGQGARWSSALHDVAWTDGDLPAVGISSGPLGRLFLGSNAAKIVRSSPVPVMLLSRDPV